MSRTVTGQTGGQKEPTEPTRVLLTETQRKWLKATGHQNNRSMSGQLRQVLDEAMKDAA